MPEDVVAMRRQRKRKSMEHAQDGSPLEMRDLSEAVPFQMKHKLKEPRNVFQEVKSLAPVSYTHLTLPTKA